MKIKVNQILKRAVTVIVAMVRAKSMALRTKTNSLKTRLVVFRLLRSNTKISHEIHTLVSGRHNKMIQTHGDSNITTNLMANETPADSNSKALVLYNADKDDDDEDCCTGSVIDMVRSCHEEDGTDFRLEDEIDVVADVFIKRFYKQMRIQKQLSIKRYHDMLQRSI